MKKIKYDECQNNISGIYKIDFPNGKCYIGKSVDIKRRMAEHNSDINQPVLYAAIQKYYNGKIKEFTIVEEVPRERLTEKEKYYIALYNSNNKEYGYNLTEGGDGAALGINNVSAIFTQEDLNNIIKLLQTTDIPMYKIAESYSCNRITIERLNSGETYYSSSLVYPIRQDKYVPKGGCQNGNSSLTEEQLQSLIEELKDPRIPFTTLMNKYNIKKNTISNINNGKSYYDESIQYPIRPKNAGQQKLFSDKELKTIYDLLLNSNNTMEYIGKQVNSSRAVISKINSGERQHQDNWTYPIRKTK